MSIWGSETFNTFGASQAVIPSATLTSDLLISKSNPAVTLSGSESNAQYTELREQGGFLYDVVNATFNGTNWVCKNTANPAYGKRLNSTGTFEFIYTAATAGNITWLVNAAVVLSSGAIVAPTIGPVSGQQHTLPAVVSDTIALLSAAQTLTNKTLSSPKITTGLLDTNGNSWIVQSAVASAVNSLQIVNAATGSAPQIAAVGSDTNIGLTITGKGTGQVFVTPTLNAGSGSANYLQVVGVPTGSVPQISAQGSDTNVGINLVTKGTGQVEVNGAAIGNPPQVTVITASGTYTTPANAKALWVRIVGGGGGGGTGNGTWSGGGGSGAYSEKLITSPAASYSVTIGAGGGAAASGGASAFGTVITGVGGGSGGAGGPNTGTGGVAGTGGDINLPGNAGGPGNSTSSLGGGGGPSHFGGGTVASGGAGNSAAANTGAGGSGGGGSSTGGSGGSGVCIVTAYF
jgi:hypothetical protein